MPIQGPAAIPPKDDPPRVIRIEPSPGTIITLAAPHRRPVGAEPASAGGSGTRGGPHYRRHHKSRGPVAGRAAHAPGIGHRDRFHRAHGGHRSHHHTDDSITHGAGDGPSGPGTRPAGTLGEMAGGLPPDQPPGGTASQGALRRSCQDGRLECLSSTPPAPSRSSRIS